MTDVVRECGIWERCADLVQRLKSYWPDTTDDNELEATLQVLLESVLAGVELRSSGLVDGGFAWAKVRLRAIGCDPEQLGKMAFELGELLVDELGEAQRPRVAALMRDVAVFLRHVAARPPEQELPAMAAGQPAERLLAAMLAGDRIRARALLLELEDPSRSLDERLEPAMREMGRRWQIGELQPAQEHIASRLVYEVVQELVVRNANVPLRERSAAYVRSVGDEHCFGQTCLQLHCSAFGVSLVSLPSVDDVEDLVPMLAGWKPSALLIGCASPRHLVTSRAILTGLRRNPQFAALPMLLGGAVFAQLPQLATQLGASAPAASGRQVAQLLAGWCASSA